MWKTRLQHTVASAAYYPQAALAWLHEVELCEMVQLGHSRRFARLGDILGEALLRTINNDGLLQDIQRWTAE